MKNYILFLLLFISGTSVAVAQQSQTEVTPAQAAHKIVFQLTTDDSLSHKALMKQLKNITTVSPETRIDVICHGPGLSMLMAKKTTVYDKIKDIQSRKSVRFYACEFSLKERNVGKAEIIPESGYVQAGIIAIVERQEQGWSYIKSGF